MKYSCEILILSRNSDLEEFYFCIVRDVLSYIFIFSVLLIKIGIKKFIFSLSLISLIIKILIRI